MLLASSSASAQQSAATKVEVCNSPWAATATYDTGNVVSYQNRNYIAAYRSQGNTPDMASGADGSGQPWVIGAACKPAKLTPDDLDHNGHFSPATLQFLQTSTGLDGEQWDNIMKLVNKSEQDSLTWTNVYGYCEDIGDDRGFTIGIFGATTGGPNDGDPDGPTLFRNFDAASGAATPSVEGGLARIGATGTMSGPILKIDGKKKDFCAKVNGLQNNPAWREAMWRTFYTVYIQPSVQEARNRGFGSALTIGSFVDTALNQGVDASPNALLGLLKRVPNSADEKTFMNAFHAERSKVVDTSHFNQAPNGLNRVKQWDSLLNEGLSNLRNCDADIVKATSWKMK
ncbi:MULTISPECIES: chitosanase [unclassified Burkholderia]|uniref:chitosanase n=1 Tax=unclassified Burkholderia TaxID=2613784 RepID=UPI00141ECCF7|nr:MULTISPECIES: chitosanase [unclassified Burkholderia]NIE84426.1 chemotaxis protein [Burkholderia sp. Tr-860]NIF64152.1 chemotaxis protein [Burkholderia sp. Cy-647]NIF98606.1 chemotaxis protein [Burkholderia sp. Ax-1720]